MKKEWHFFEYVFLCVSYLVEPSLMFHIPPKINNYQLECDGVGIQNGMETLTNEPHRIKNE